GPLGAEEAHGEQDEIDVQGELAARHRPEVEASTLAGHLDGHAVELPDVAALVTGEPLGRDGVDALTALLVGARGPEDVRPLWPRVVGRPGVGRARQELELVNGGGALTVHGAQAVGAGVAASDDHHALAGCADELLVGDDIALAALVGEGEIVHGEVDALELATGKGQVARPAGAAGR